MRPGTPRLLDVSCEHAIGRTPYSRRDICEATDTYELVEAYPDDKYLPSYLVLAAMAGNAFHVLFAADVSGDNVRVVTSYRPTDRLGIRHEDKETATMKCLVCGATLRSTTTDLPLKVNDRTIVVVKKLPVLQCEGCIEYLIEDPVMAKVDEMLSRVDRSIELEIVPFAA